MPIKNYAKISNQYRVSSLLEKNCQYQLLPKGCQRLSLNSVDFQAKR